MAKAKQERRVLPKKDEATQSGPPVDPSSEPVTAEVKKAARGKKTDPSGNPVTPRNRKGLPKASQKPQDATGEAQTDSAGGTALATVEAPQGILEALSADEVVEREQLEYEVDQGLEGAFKVANALLTIREKRLYRSTHSTYEEYVEERFHMSSRRARHLTFAAGVVKSVEDAGVTELPTNESQVRGLASVVPEDRAKVWEEARQTGVANGKVPTRQDVQKAASRVGRPKGAKGSGSRPTPEQQKILEAVQRGAIRDAEAIKISSVEEGVDEAMVADIDLPDSEWLAQFPIREELNEYCRTLFDQEALYYRWFSPHRKPLVRNITSKLGDEVRKVAKRVGPYVSRIEKALSLADPRTWKVCKACNGTGQVEQVGGCPDCKTAGYRLA